MGRRVRWWPYSRTSAEKCCPRPGTSTWRGATGQASSVLCRSRNAVSCWERGFRNGRKEWEGGMFKHADAGYFAATRHPWPCLLFLMPLLASYEGGVFWLGGAHPDALRIGADNWVRCALTAVGLPFF